MGCGCWMLTRRMTMRKKSRKRKTAEPPTGLRTYIFNVAATSTAKPVLLKSCISRGPPPGRGRSDAGTHPRVWRAEAEKVDRTQFRVTVESMRVAHRAL